MEHKKLAFLFLIYGEIKQEELWYNFFKNVDVNKYSIYIHYKNNKPLKFFNQFKLKKCFKTNYADISLVYAHNLLIYEALKDNNNYKFINLSQSCIPLKSFNYIYNSLTHNNYSIFNESPQNGCFPRCNNVLNFLKKEDIYKSADWFILNRKYAELVVWDKEYLEYFKNVPSPEEHYYLSIIKNKSSATDLICTPNLANGASTFINWDNMDYPNEFVSKKGLKTYSEISEEEMNLLLNSPCLFGRKFTKSCTVNNLNLKDYLKNKLC